MTVSCVGRPVSWLTLEQYHLGELPAEETHSIQTHLEACRVCRQCLEHIQEDHPTAEASAPQPFSAHLSTLHSMAARRRFRIVPVAVAMAAVVLTLVLTLDSGEGTGRIPDRRIVYKGGELALSLVRERQRVVSQDPETFTAEDRFKVLITCPPGPGLYGEVVVFQNGEVSFPFSPFGLLACGNRVPLQGAFRITGNTPATVCLVTMEDERDGRVLSPSGPDQLGPGSVCATLIPVP